MYVINTVDLDKINLLGCTLIQWSSRCAPVYTSVHENYFTVHKNICKIKKYFLNYTNFVFF